MIYSNMIENKSLIKNSNSERDSIDIYIDTKCDLRKVIRFLDEHYIPKEKQEEPSDWEKKQRDKQRKENDQEAKKQKQMQNNTSTSGAFHINIEIKTKNYDFKVHIRNKEGASHDDSEARHGATAKIIKQGLTDNNGIPVLISTGKIIPNNVNKSIADNIERKYPLALEFISENKMPLIAIWNSNIPEEINKNLNIIESNIATNSKYISYKINY